jgi:hypothetical protein
VIRVHRKNITTGFPFFLEKLRNFYENFKILDGTSELFQGYQDICGKTFHDPCFGKSDILSRTRVQSQNSVNPSVSLISKT